MGKILFFANNTRPLYENETAHSMKNCVHAKSKYKIQHLRNNEIDVFICKVKTECQYHHMLLNAIIYLTLILFSFFS